MSEQNQESKCCEVCGYTQTLPLTHHHDCAWVLKPKLAAAEAELALLRGDPAAVAERADAVVNYVRYGCMAGAAAHSREAVTRFVASALQPPPKTRFASVDELVYATMTEGVRKRYHELVAATDAAAVADTRRLDWLEQDGNLKHLWNTSVPAKSLRDCTWDVREAIDGAMQLHGAPPAAGWDPATAAFIDAALQHPGSPAAGGAK